MANAGLGVSPPIAISIVRTYDRAFNICKLERMADTVKTLMPVRPYGS